MLYYVTTSNVVIPIITATRIHNGMMMLFNLAFILIITPVAGYSLYMARGIWGKIYNTMSLLNELFWSPMSLIITTILTGVLSLYILYKISQDITQKIASKINKLNEELESRNNEIAGYMGIFNELESLKLDTVPAEYLAPSAREERNKKLTTIMEKIKKARELNKLTIDVELTKKIN